VAVLRLVREHLVAGKSASEVERLLVERRGRVIDASSAEPEQATLARADCAKYSYSFERKGWRSS